MELLRYQRFGPKADRVTKEQLALFDEAELNGVIGRDGRALRLDLRRRRQDDADRERLRQGGLQQGHRLRGRYRSGCPELTAAPRHHRSGARVRGGGIESSGGNGSGGPAQENLAIPRPLPLGHAARAHLRGVPADLPTVRGRDADHRLHCPAAVDVRAILEHIGEPDTPPCSAQARGSPLPAFHNPIHCPPKNPSRHPLAGRFRPDRLPTLLRRGFQGFRCDLTVTRTDRILR
jgi:hypothetical protein